MKSTLVLVERNAHLASGHHHGALIALARAYQPTMVIVPNGVTPESRAALVDAQARVVDRPHGAAARILTVAARATEATAHLVLALFRARRWPKALRRAPHQITALARCLTEAVAVRTGRRLAGAHPVTVLSAGEALHTTAGLLGGPHARYVHEINTTEDPLLRFLGRITSRPRLGPLIRYLDQELAHRPRTAITRTRHGDLVAVTTSDLIQRFLYLHGVWEPYLTAWIRGRLTRGDTFIDVGAHTGYYTLLASRLVGAPGRVVAIEASPAFHTSLTEAVQRNACHKVRTVNAAAADTARTLTFYLQDTANLGNTSAVQPKTSHSSFQIGALPLPEILSPHELAAARLIKIDFEGAEAFLMEGLAPVLGNLRPDVELVIEVTPDPWRSRGRVCTTSWNPSGRTASTRTASPTTTTRPATRARSADRLPPSVGTVPSAT